MPFINRPIRTKHARKLADNYRKQKKGRLIEEGETLGVWFSRNILEQALGITGPDAGKNISGLRFYMGAYEKDFDDYPNDPDYKGKITLIIVQTTEGTPGKDGRPVYVDILEDPYAKPEYDQDIIELHLNESERRQEYNDGQLCPPPAGCQRLGLLDF